MSLEFGRQLLPAYLITVSGWTPWLEGPEMEETDNAEGQDWREFLSETVLGSLCSGKTETESSLREK